MATLHETEGLSPTATARLQLDKLKLTRDALDDTVDLARLRRFCCTLRDAKFDWEAIDRTRPQRFDAEAQWLARLAREVIGLIRDVRQSSMQIEGIEEVEQSIRHHLRDIEQRLAWSDEQRRCPEPDAPQAGTPLAGS